MKVIEVSKNIMARKIICDICYKGHAKYFGDGECNKYNICQECFVDNPHKNHKLIKLEMEKKIKSGEKTMKILENSLYMHYIVKIIRLFDSNELNDLCNNKKSNRFFSKNDNENTKEKSKIGEYCENYPSSQKNRYIET